MRPAKAKRKRVQRAARARAWARSDSFRRLRQSQEMLARDGARRAVRLPSNPRAAQSNQRVMLKRTNLVAGGNAWRSGSEQLAAHRSNAHSPTANPTAKHKRTRPQPLPVRSSLL